MEYVEGETLYRLLRREGTWTRNARRIMRQIVAGVDAAHDVGILHRDLKPANIFLMQQQRSRAGSEDGFVKVGDFGLAKIVNPDRSDYVRGGPASRGIIGTPEFMAPEQMQPGIELDARADIYALGTIAYHMLGGRPPFTGNITQLIPETDQVPPALSTLRSDISARSKQRSCRRWRTNRGIVRTSANGMVREFCRRPLFSDSRSNEAKRGDSRARDHGAVGLGSLRRRRTIRQRGPIGSCDSDVDRLLCWNLGPQFLIFILRVYYFLEPVPRFPRNIEMLLVNYSTRVISRLNRTQRYWHQLIP